MSILQICPIFNFYLDFAGLLSSNKRKANALSGLPMVFLMLIPVANVVRFVQLLEIKKPALPSYHRGRTGEKNHTILNIQQRVEVSLPALPNL